ncbi:MAG: glycosyltransferase [Elusimicrobia bacterium]|nr:glycosyltransferase [Elusimicrobiota bacterium]
MDINKDSKKISFCIVVPMYNEESNAEKCVTTIHDFISKLSYKTALIAVNDGSKDKTGDILKNISTKLNKFIIETHEKNKGYGSANLTGAKRAFKEGYDYALFMDADLTQNVSYIYPFIEEMNKGTDFIKATRYAKGGGVKDVPFNRWIVSLIGNKIIKIFFRLPLTDYTNGFRAVKTCLLSQIECEDRGFSYLIEEVKKISKISKSYAEVPYILTVRESKYSKSKFQYSPKVYYKYLRYLFKK